MKSDSNKKGCHQSLKEIAAGIKFESHKLLLMTSWNVSAIVSHIKKCSKVYTLEGLIHGARLWNVFKTTRQGARRKTLYLVIFIKNPSLSFPMHHRNFDATLQACKYDGRDSVPHKSNIMWAEIIELVHGFDDWGFTLLTSYM
jgi:hypothetical protein